MDAPPWKPGNVWSLQLLVRRKIQKTLLKAVSLNTLAPVERSQRLPLQPLLYRMVVNDAITLEFEDWFHLSMADRPPTGSLKVFWPTINTE